MQHMNKSTAEQEYLYLVLRLGEFPSDPHPSPPRRKWLRDAGLLAPVEETWVFSDMHTWFMQQPRIREIDRHQAKVLSINLLTSQDIVNYLAIRQ